MKIKLLVADQNQLFRELLTKQFAMTPDIEVVAEAASSAEVLDKLNLVAVDIVLTEVFAPNLNGIELAKHISLAHPLIKVVALTTNIEKQVIQDMIQSNAWGYLIKDVTFVQLCDHIRLINKGNRILSPNVQSRLIEDFISRDATKTQKLTKREAEVLLLLAEGKTIKEISDKIFVSVKTTCTHRQHIFEKLGFENMAQLVRYAYKMGLVT